MTGPVNPTPPSSGSSPVNPITTSAKVPDGTVKVIDTTLTAVSDTLNGMQDTLTPIGCYPNNPGIVPFQHEFQCYRRMLQGLNGSLIALSQESPAIKAVLLPTTSTLENFLNHCQVGETPSMGYYTQVQNGLKDSEALANKYLIPNGQPIPSNVPSLLSIINGAVGISATFPIDATNATDVRLQKTLGGALQAYANIFHAYSENSQSANVVAAGNTAYNAMMSYLVTPLSEGSYVTAQEQSAFMTGMQQAGSQYGGGSS